MEQVDLLKWSDNGDSVIISLSEGDQGPFTTKNDAIKAIYALLSNLKIKVTEFEEMREKIVTAEKLPWANKQSNDLLEALRAIYGIMPEGAHVLLIEIRTTYSKDEDKNQNNPGA